MPNQSSPTGRRTAQKAGLERQSKPPPASKRYMVLKAGGNEKKRIRVNPAEYQAWVSPNPDDITTDVVSCITPRYPQPYKVFEPSSDIPHMLSICRDSSYGVQTLFNTLSEELLLNRFYQDRVPSETMTSSDVISSTDEEHTEPIMEVEVVKTKPPIVGTVSTERQKSEKPGVWSIASAIKLSERLNIQLQNVRDWREKVAEIMYSRGNTAPLDTRASLSEVKELVTEGNIYAKFIELPELSELSDELHQCESFAARVRALLRFPDDVWFGSIVEVASGYSKPPTDVAAESSLSSYNIVQKEVNDYDNRRYRNVTPFNGEGVPAASEYKMSMSELAKLVREGIQTVPYITDEFNFLREQFDLVGAWTKLVQAAVDEQNLDRCEQILTDQDCSFYVKLPGHSDLKKQVRIAGWIQKTSRLVQRPFKYTYAEGLIKDTICSSIDESQTPCKRELIDRVKLARSWNEKALTSCFRSLLGNEDVKEYEALVNGENVNEPLSTKSSYNETKPTPQELEEFCNEYQAFKLIIPYYRYFEPFLGKVRKLAKKEKRLLKRSLSLHECIIYLQEAEQLNVSLDMKDMIVFVQEHVEKAKNFAAKAKKFIDAAKDLTVRCGVAKSSTDFFSAEALRRRGKFQLSDLESVLNTSPPQCRPSMDELNALISEHDNLMIQNTSVLNEMNELLEKGERWTKRASDVLKGDQSEKQLALLILECLNLNICLVVEQKLYTALRYRVWRLKLTQISFPIPETNLESLLSDLPLIDTLVDHDTKVKDLIISEVPENLAQLTESEFIKSLGETHKEQVEKLSDLLNVRPALGRTEWAVLINDALELPVMLSNMITRVDNNLLEAEKLNSEVEAVSENSSLDLFEKLKERVNSSSVSIIAWREKCIIYNKYKLVNDEAASLLESKVKVAKLKEFVTKHTTGDNDNNNIMNNVPTAGKILLVLKQAEEWFSELNNFLTNTGSLSDWESLLNTERINAIQCDLDIEDIRRKLNESRLWCHIYQCLSTRVCDFTVLNRLTNAISFCPSFKPFTVCQASVREKNSSSQSMLSEDRVLPISLFHALVITETPFGLGTALKEFNCLKNSLNDSLSAEKEMSELISYLEERRKYDVHTLDMSKIPNLVDSYCIPIDMPVHHDLKNEIALCQQTEKLIRVLNIQPDNSYIKEPINGEGGINIVTSQLPCDEYIGLEYAENLLNSIALTNSCLVQNDLTEQKGNRDSTKVEYTDIFDLIALLPIDGGGGGVHPKIEKIFEQRSEIFARMKEKYSEHERRSLSPLNFEWTNMLKVRVLDTQKLVDRTTQILPDGKICDDLSEKTYSNHITNARSRFNHVFKYLPKDVKCFMVQSIGNNKIIDEISIDLNLLVNAKYDDYNTYDDSSCSPAYAYSLLGGRALEFFEAMDSQSVFWPSKDPYTLRVYDNDRNDGDNNNNYMPSTKVYSNSKKGKKGGGSYIYGTVYKNHIPTDNQSNILDIEFLKKKTNSEQPTFFQALKVLSSCNRSLWFCDKSIVWLRSVIELNLIFLHLLRNRLPDKIFNQNLSLKCRPRFRTGAKLLIPEDPDLSSRKRLPNSSELPIRKKRKRGKVGGRKPGPQKVKKQMDSIENEDCIEIESQFTSKEMTVVMPSSSTYYYNINNNKDQDTCTTLVEKSRRRKNSCNLDNSHVLYMSSESEDDSFSNYLYDFVEENSKFEVNDEPWECVKVNITITYKQEKEKEEEEGEEENEKEKEKEKEEEEKEEEGEGKEEGKNINEFKCPGIHSSSLLCSLNSILTPTFNTQIDTDVDGTTNAVPILGRPVNEDLTPTHAVMNEYPPLLISSSDLPRTDEVSTSEIMNAINLLDLLPLQIPLKRRLVDGLLFVLDWRIQAREALQFLPRDSIRRFWTETNELRRTEIVTDEMVVCSSRKEVLAEEERTSIISDENFFYELGVTKETFSTDFVTKCFKVSDEEKMRIGYGLTDVENTFSILEALPRGSDTLKNVQKNYVVTTDLMARLDACVPEICGLCAELCIAHDGSSWIACDVCHSWYHTVCCNTVDPKSNRKHNSDSSWICPVCTYENVNLGYLMNSNICSISLENKNLLHNDIMKIHRDPKTSFNHLRKSTSRKIPSLFRYIRLLRTAKLKPFISSIYLPEKYIILEKLCSFSLWLHDVRKLFSLKAKMWNSTILKSDAGTEITLPYNLGVYTMKTNRPDLIRCNELSDISQLHWLLLVGLHKGIGHVPELTEVVNTISAYSLHRQQIMKTYNDIKFASDMIIEYNDIHNNNNQDNNDFNNSNDNNSDPDNTILANPLLLPHNPYTSVFTLHNLKFGPMATPQYMNKNVLRNKLTSFVNKLKNDTSTAVSLASYGDQNVIETPSVSPPRNAGDISNLLTKLFQFFIHQKTSQEETSPNLNWIERIQFQQVEALLLEASKISISIMGEAELGLRKDLEQARGSQSIINTELDQKNLTESLRDEDAISLLKSSYSKGIVLDRENEFAQKLFCKIWISTATSICSLLKTRKESSPDKTEPDVPLISESAKQFISHIPQPVCSLHSLRILVFDFIKDSACSNDASPPSNPQYEWMRYLPDLSHDKTRLIASSKACELFNILWDTYSATLAWEFENVNAPYLNINQPTMPELVVISQNSEKNDMPDNESLMCKTQLNVFEQKLTEARLLQISTSCTKAFKTIVSQLTQAWSFFERTKSPNNQFASLQQLMDVLEKFEAIPIVLRVEQELQQRMQQLQVWIKSVRGALSGQGNYSLAYYQKVEQQAASLPVNMTKTKIMSDLRRHMAHLSEHNSYYDEALKDPNQRQSSYYANHRDNKSVPSIINRSQPINQMYASSSPAMIINPTLERERPNIMIHNTYPGDSRTQMNDNFRKQNNNRKDTNNSEYSFHHGKQNNESKNNPLTLINNYSNRSTVFATTNQVDQGSDVLLSGKGVREPDIQNPNSHSDRIPRTRL